MFDVWHLLWIVPFCLTLGVIFNELMGRYNRRQAEIKIVEKEEGEEPSSEEKDPMALRNGFGVTRDENPTFLEQVVNVMNYSGENQKEAEYEE